MADGKKSKLPGRRVERSKAVFSQTDLATHEAWAHFTLESPPAAALVHLLCRLAGDDDTVVASQRVLGERLGVSAQTIGRAVRKAAAARYLEVIRLGATATGACGYRLNSRVHWTKDSEGKASSTFRAVVLASAEDQPTIEAAPLRRVPVIRPGEIPLPTGPGLPPPSQPTLSGMEPVLFRDPDTGELFDVDPTSGELQARLPIQASPEAPQAPPAPAEPPSTGQRMKDALADAGDALTAWEKGFFADLTAKLDAGAILSDRQEAKALSILDRIED